MKRSARSIDRIVQRSQRVHDVAHHGPHVRVIVNAMLSRNRQRSRHLLREGIHHIRVHEGLQVRAGAVEVRACPRRQGLWFASRTDAHGFLAREKLKEDNTIGVHVTLCSQLTCRHEARVWSVRREDQPKGHYLPFEVHGRYIHTGEIYVVPAY